MQPAIKKKDKDGMEVNGGSWSKGETCHNDKPGHVGEQMEGR